MYVKQQRARPPPPTTSRPLWTAGCWATHQNDSGKKANFARVQKLPKNSRTGSKRSGHTI